MATNNRKNKHVWPNQTPRQKRLDAMMFSKHWQITIRVVAITLITIATFGFAGYMIDKQLNSKPIATMIAVIGSYPAAQLIIYKVFKKITK